MGVNAGLFKRAMTELKELRGAPDNLRASQEARLLSGTRRPGAIHKPAASQQGPDALDQVEVGGVGWQVVNDQPVPGRRTLAVLQPCGR